MTLSADAAFVVQVLLGSLLGWSALGKVGRIRPFAAGIASYRLIPVRLTPIVAVVVVLGEAGMALLLLTGTAISVTAALASVTFLVFAAALGFALVGRRDIACHCFGVEDDEKVTWITVGRAIALALLGLLLAQSHDATLIQIPAGRVLPLITIAAGAAVIARYAGYVLPAWRALREPSMQGVKPTERVTCAHLPRDASLFGEGGGRSIRHGISGLDPTARETGVPT